MASLAVLPIRVEEAMVEMANGLAHARNEPPLRKSKHILLKGQNNLRHRLMKNQEATIIRKCPFSQDISHSVLFPKNMSHSILSASTILLASVSTITFLNPLSQAILSPFSTAQALASSDENIPRLAMKPSIQLPLSSRNTPPQPAIPVLLFLLPSVLSLSQPDSGFDHRRRLLLVSLLPGTLALSKAARVSATCISIQFAFFCILFCSPLKTSSFLHFHNH
nr:hypothetical protein PRUPE_6G176100 [Ipomoea trifida]